MTTPSVLGNSSTVGYNLSASGSYTNFANLYEVTTPSPEITEVPVSGLADAADLRIPGTADWKQFTFTVYHNATNFTAIFTTLIGVPAYWQVAFSDTHGFECSNSFIKSAKGKLDRNKALMWEVTVAISGACTMQ
jgi:hypothetical protein